MTGAGGAKPFEIYDIAFADGPGVYDLFLRSEAGTVNKSDLIAAAGRSTTV